MSAKCVLRNSYYTVQYEDGERINRETKVVKHLNCYRCLLSDVGDGDRLFLVLLTNERTKEWSDDSNN